MKTDDCETLNCHSIIELGKLAKHLFPATHTLSQAAYAGDVFYIVGFMLGLILWGFAIVWFIVAVIMIAVSGRFPFNMGWWGFIFPIGQCPPLSLLYNTASLTINWTGVFTLLTITIGEELESRFFKVLSCVRSFSFRPSLTRAFFLTLVLPALGFDSDMYHYVARDCCTDSAAFYHGQDVLCPMPGYGFVPETAEGREDGFERAKGGSMIVVNRDSAVVSSMLSSPKLRFVMSIQVLGL